MCSAHLSSPPPLEPSSSALFLDLDGTIAEFRSRPGDVPHEPDFVKVLVRLQFAMAGRLAVLTGRSLAEVDRILGGSIASVAAVHGLVRRLPDGNVVRTPGTRSLTKARRSLRTLARSHDGLILEDKTSSIALHYRQLPDAEAAIRTRVDRIAAQTDLVVQNGSMVSEIRVKGPDKGTALKQFLEIEPFAGFRPVMIGDDLTDEHAFAAAAQMGGYGILVGAPRVTAARYGLPSVNDVRAWLIDGAGR